MKIRFVNNVYEVAPDIPFAVYQYDASIVENLKYIDIKSIIQQHHLSWLDEVQCSHAQLSEKFSRTTRWWWITPMSRLDARPWGQEYILKPLFFARAVIQWMESYSDIKEIALVGCDSEVARYLHEFSGSVVINGIARIPLGINTLLVGLKCSILAVLKMGVHFFVLCRDHVFHKSYFVRSNTLVLYDLLSSDSISFGHRYFYGSLFDSIKGRETISFACVTGAKPRHNVDKGTAKDGEKTFYLLDNIGPVEAMLSLGANVLLIFLNWVFALLRHPITLGGKVSYLFWGDYLFKEFQRLPCLSNIAGYWSLKRILQQHEYKTIVYPYEEKGSERAILFACREGNVRTIGYAPHPQHRLTLALRDMLAPFSPKPSMYAVCGPAYIDYLKGWGKKDGCQISVWGSGKLFKKIYETKEFFDAEIKVLVLFSHPNELRVFSSWLRAEKMLIEKTKYYLRLYKALKNNALLIELKKILDGFPCVSESDSTLDEDLLKCDIAVFCATSAGIVAIKHGFLAIHIRLDDFFPMNPCFDRMQNMLQCSSPLQFADRLQEIRRMSNETRMKLYNQQQEFANTIFAPVQLKNIKEDLFCSKK